MTVVFDSYGFVKRLTAAGMPESQAEVLADEHSRWFVDFLATKADLAPLAKVVDLKELELRLKSQTDALELKLTSQTEALKLELTSRVGSIEHRLEAVKSEILKWTYGAVGFQTLVLVGAVVALARSLR